MSFASVHFLIFLPLVATVYFLLPLRARRLFLLAASYYFYCVWSFKWSVLLIYATLLDYVAGLVIGTATRPLTRKLALGISLTGNLVALGVFKYFDFIGGSLAALFGQPVWPTLDLVLPMGISFYTFQTMSYTIDVYRGVVKPTRSLADFALFVTFFPHLVAGPIMRAADLLPQFQEDHQPNSERILSGAVLCVWGLSKKVFVADPMGYIVESVYGTVAAPLAPSTFSGAALLLATYAFALQIYCDFSAYSDIARGAARILGFRLIQNFDAPYLAVTISDFWSRWHISLSKWLRDYVYVPLGGNRKGPSRTYVNLTITMLLGGLWHGANWTFIAWGAVHGLALSVERMLGARNLHDRAMSPLERWCRILVTFHIVCLGWVLFRSPTIAHAAEVVWRIVTLAPGEATTMTPALVLVVLFAMQATGLSPTLRDNPVRYPGAARWVVYATAVLLLVALSGARTPEFIYFQF
jgi:D-alanyl-lipoteichoic acid acyltransferase DltB (MBOAT superfamily)